MDARNVAQFAASRLFTLDSVEPETPPLSDVHRVIISESFRKSSAWPLSVGASVVRGRITPHTRLAADLAERYADGHVRATPCRIFSSSMSRRLTFHRSRTRRRRTSSRFRCSRHVACTGPNSASSLTETKSFALAGSLKLEDRYPDFEHQLSASPAAPTVAANTDRRHRYRRQENQVDGKLVDAYYFCVGGSVGHIASIARPVGFRCRADEVPDAISRLLTHSNPMPPW